MVNVTASKEPKEGIDFFPLSVDFEEKMYSVGKIPGSYTKREGKPSDKAILVSRAIDRPLRPLFPNGISDIDNAADAPIIAATSGELSCSTHNTVATTTTSFLKSFGNNGLNGLSIARDINIALSLGFPSLFV